jgi:parallel beta-helix repeat protein
MILIKKKLLGIFFCMLLLLSAIVPISATTVSEKTSQSLTMGNILYVGGLGPNNYTKIQDAINAAVNGDTVFVFDDSSPYYENILIDKSISLIGEQKETTSIYGDNSSDELVNITADDVCVSGFTIQPYNGEHTGILIDKNYTIPYWNIAVIKNVTISNNIIKNTSWAGVFAIRLINGTIMGNDIDQCDGNGILLYISSNTFIFDNVISNCSYRGIEIDGVWNLYRLMNYRNPVPKNNVISGNIIRSNRWGIELNSGPEYTTISSNTITENHEIGIQIVYASKTLITQNNFVDNSENAHFMAALIFRYPRFVFNTWDGNYWGEPKKLPVRIDGTFYFIPFPRLPYGFTIGHFTFNLKVVPWIAFDKHPTQEPYDIPLRG